MNPPSPDFVPLPTETAQVPAWAAQFHPELVAYLRWLGERLVEGSGRPDDVTAFLDRLRLHGWQPLAPLTGTLVHARAFTWSGDAAAGYRVATNTPLNDLQELTGQVALLHRSLEPVPGWLVETRSDLAVLITGFIQDAMAGRASFGLSGGWAAGSAAGGVPAGPLAAAEAAWQSRVTELFRPVGLQAVAIGNALEYRLRMLEAKLQPVTRSGRTDRTGRTPRTLPPHDPSHPPVLQHYPPGVRAYPVPGHPTLHLDRVGSDLTTSGTLRVPDTLTEQQASQLQKTVNEGWTRRFAHSSIRTDIQVQRVPAGEGTDLVLTGRSGDSPGDPRDHDLDLDRVHSVSDWLDELHDAKQPADRQMRLPHDYTAQDVVREFGHALDLPDQYTLDPQGHPVPRPGHETDVMAGTASGVVDVGTVDDLVARRDPQLGQHFANATRHWVQQADDVALHALSDDDRQAAIDLLQTGIVFDADRAAVQRLLDTAPQRPAAGSLAGTLPR